MQQLHIHTISIVLLSFLLFFSWTGWSQTPSLSESTQVSVLTCGVGDELYSIFGHTALRFVDREQKLDVVFNYGTFDFSTPRFYSKFVKGDLMYHLSTDSYANFLYNYEQENRSVDEQFLNLTAAQKLQIWEKIQLQLHTQERFYQYKFIDNNCTTKVADLLNEVLPQPLVTHFEGNNENYRPILNSYLNNHYFEKLGINLVFGRKVDQPNTDLVFLPNKLQQSIAVSQNGALPLLIKENQIVPAHRVGGFHFFDSYVFFLILCLFLAALSSYTIIRNLWMVVIALIGVFLAAVSLYSNHQEVHYNEVFLLCNPLYFIYLFLQNIKYKKRMLLLLTVVLVGYVFWINLEKLYIFSPLILTTFVVLFWEFKTLKK